MSKHTTENPTASQQQSDDVTTVTPDELGTDNLDEVVGGGSGVGFTRGDNGASGGCNHEDSAPPIFHPWGCFVAGTRISMADGSSRPIEEVEVGDQVLAYDDRTREVVASRVADKFVHPDIDDGLIRINGRLEATPYHMIHASGRYLRVDELQLGSVLVALSEAAVARTEPTMVTSLERFNRKQ